MAMKAVYFSRLKRKWKEGTHHQIFWITRKAHTFDSLSYWFSIWLPSIAYMLAKSSLHAQAYSQKRKTKQFVLRFFRLNHFHHVYYRHDRRRVVFSAIIIILMHLFSIEFPPNRGIFCILLHQFALQLLLEHILKQVIHCAEAYTRWLAYKQQLRLFIFHFDLHSKLIRKCNVGQHKPNPIHSNIHTHTHERR